VLSQQAFKAAHRLLQTRGPDKSTWTVSLGSLRWHRLENGRWQPDEPPDALEIDSAALKLINAAIASAASRAGSADAVRIAHSDLKRAIQRVRCGLAASDQDGRSGVLLALEPGTLTLAATDGVRLVLATAPAQGGKEQRQAVVPPASIAKLLTVLHDGDEMAEIALSDAGVQFHLSDGVLESRLHGAKFPEYKWVLPRETSPLLRVSRASLKAALTRVASKAGQTRIDWSLDGAGVQLSSGRAAPERLKGSYRGAPLQTAFNADYVLEALGELRGDEVEIGLSDMGAATFTDPGSADFKYVLMSMRPGQAH
jgi:DNA polymerase-3 subunit beta